MDAVTSLFAGGNTGPVSQYSFGNVVVKKAKTKSVLLTQCVAQAVP